MPRPTWPTRSGASTPSYDSVPLASYHNQPHAPCPHGCKHPQSNERVKVRDGYHLVTDCARQTRARSRTRTSRRRSSTINTYRLRQGKPGQEVAQGRRGDDHPPSTPTRAYNGEQGQALHGLPQGRRGDDNPPLQQYLHEHHGDQSQACHRLHASRHPPLRHHHHRQPCCA